MRTREQLALEGRLLIGPLVPKWFKLQSDGCSVPLGKVGKWALKADQARPACIIHDLRYYEIAIQYDPEGTDAEKASWKLARMKADYELKQNRRLVAKVRFFGRLYAIKYFRAVRAFGASCVKTIPELPIPPTILALEALEALFDDKLTKRAENIFHIWRLAIENSD